MIFFLLNLSLYFKGASIEGKKIISDGFANLETSIEVRMDIVDI